MRIEYGDDFVFLFAEKCDTWNWAHRPDSCWPCSELAGHWIQAQWDKNGLTELIVSGQQLDVSVDEFNAFTSDMLKDSLPETHPCWFVCVGQFLETEKVV